MAKLNCLSGSVSTGITNIDVVDATVTVNQKVIDTTTLSDGTSGWRTDVAGFRDWTVSGKGFLKGTITQMPTTTVTVSLTDGQGTTRTGLGYFESFAQEYNVDGANECSFTVKGTGSLTNI